MKKKIVMALAGPISFLLLVIMAVTLIFGAVFSLVESIQSWWDSIGMVDEAELTEENMNNPEFIYEAVCSNKDNMNAMNLLMMDYGTTYLIFKGIHDYDDYRKTPKEITYSYRIADEDEALNDMNMYNGEYTDDSIKAASTKETKKISLTPSSIEFDTDDLGSGILAMRWQPIYAACAVVGMDNYENYGSVKDMDLETTTFEGYYIASEDVDKICELFQMHIEFKFDATDKKNYSFNYLGQKKSAYKMKVYDTDDGGKITERVPAIAPDSVHNGFIKYSYQYESVGIENTEICSSRYMVVTPSTFITTMKEIDPKFDMFRFRAILDALPATDDLVEFYSRSEFDTLAVFDETINPDTNDYFGNRIFSSECPSIGVIYHSKANSTGTSIEVDWEGGETFGVPVYDFLAADGINPVSGTACRARELYVEKEDGCDYGLYQVYNFALRPFTESDGLNHDQLLEVVEGCLDGFYVNSGSCLFDEDNRDATVDTILRFQDECNCSVIALLAIMKAEGAITGSDGYGNKHYNFFNIKGTPVISGSDGFKDYKGAGYTMQDALYTQMYSTVYDKYIAAGQVNYYLFSWNNYDGVSYASLAHCYCPVWDDPSFGWAEGSWFTGYTLTSAGKGWVNTNAEIMYKIEAWAEANLDDWSHEPFAVDAATDESIFGKIGDWLHKLFFGD